MTRLETKVQREWTQLASHPNSRIESTLRLEDCGRYIGIAHSTAEEGREPKKET